MRPIRLVFRSKHCKRLRPFLIIRFIPSAGVYLSVPLQASTILPIHIRALAVVVPFSTIREQLRIDLTKPGVISLELSNRIPGYQSSDESLAITAIELEEEVKRAS